MHAASSSCFSFRKVSRVGPLSRHSRSRASSRVLIRARRAARSSASTGILRRQIVAGYTQLLYGFVFVGSWLNPRRKAGETEGEERVEDLPKGCRRPALIPIPRR